MYKLWLLSWAISLPFGQVSERFFQSTIVDFQFVFTSPVDLVTLNYSLHVKTRVGQNKIKRLQNHHEDCTQWGRQVFVILQIGCSGVEQVTKVVGVSILQIACTCQRWPRYNANYLTFVVCKWICKHHPGCFVACSSSDGCQKPQKSFPFQAGFPPHSLM